MRCSTRSVRGFARMIFAVGLILGLALDLSAQEQNLTAGDVLDQAMAEAGLDEAGMDGADAAAVATPVEGLNVLTLVLQGGLLMIPIGIMSIIVVTLGLERAIALRRGRVIPAELVRGLGDLGEIPGKMDPRKAYRLCQQFPSSASNVIRAMLLKTGRPQSEVEHTVSEASEREAARLYSNVRWLNLIAAIAPLVGLFGTVWGMIRAFFDTTQLVAGQNKADFLAQGIYVALVTTLGGLAVAIPAAILSHYFEGRIQKLFYEVDELLFNLLPQVERFEGRMRVTREKLSEAEDADSEQVTAPDPASA